jgi:hypothetical protein
MYVYHSFIEYPTRMHSFFNNGGVVVEVADEFNRRHSQRNLIRHGTEEIPE